MFKFQAGDHGDRLRTAQAKWDWLTVTDYEQITTVPELITAVAQRYSLPHEQAKRDVERWAMDMRLKAAECGHDLEAVSKF
jgi:hypothetical protein